jgi:elongation factor 3
VDECKPLVSGEAEPDIGTVWRHPNMRYAYVAQHAFHHVEQHLEKTPNEYIRWRYQTGEDKENLTKVTAQYTDEEIRLMKEKIPVPQEDGRGLHSFTFQLNLSRV